MELDVYTKDGTLTGRKVEVPDGIFSIEPNEHVVYLAVNAQATNLRHGTVATKTRSMVSGGGKKPWKQKGRGTARSGSSRSPVWRGGGTTHGPQPQDHNFRLPKKVRRLARISVLADKISMEALKVLEDFTVELAKTKNVAIVLKNFKLSGTKTLMLLPAYDAELLRASRNIKNLKVQVAADASTRDLLDCKALLVMESAIKNLEGTLLS